nr:MAG TPA: hypothetical protein [Caudoviricetes sp.]
MAASTTKRRSMMMLFNCQCVYWRGLLLGALREGISHLACLGEVDVLDGLAVVKDILVTNRDALAGKTSDGAIDSASAKAKYLCQFLGGHINIGICLKESNDRLRVLGIDLLCHNRTPFDLGFYPLLYAKNMLLDTTFNVNYKLFGSWAKS